MKSKIFIPLLAFFILSSVYSQADLNNYKYVIVPNKFDFLNEENQYRLNELAQFLFNKYGFTAVMEGTEYPEDLLFNGCLGLRSDVQKESGMFKTKLKVILKDCNGRVMHTTPLGESREKEFRTAYTLALRDAFTHFETLDYKYSPKEGQDVTLPKAQEQKNEVASEIEKLKEEIENLKKEKEIEEVKPPVPVVEKTQPAPVKMVKTEPSKVEAKIEKGASDILYAQEIEHGFQLVDSSPKVVYRIKKTGLENVFLVEGKSNLVYKKGNTWVLEYYENGKLKQQELNIKF